MKTEMKNFVAVDLHVHTPSSHCYKGTKSDDEYLAILERYIAKNVKIIAITDHNTLNGYKKLIHIKISLISKNETLKELVSKYPELQAEIDENTQKLSLFDKICILPGMEFEANPGIHLLFIFNPKQDLDEIDTFLENAGYNEASQGLEIVSNVNFDVIEALKKAKDLNAITIGAHIDSDKGLFNDLKGSFRKRVLISDDLDGISINSLVQIDKIKEILKDPQYKRNNQLAIIQSSDHHEESDCGRQLTYFKLPEFSFEGLNGCFNNPNELISSTERPEIINIIKKIAEDNNTICIESIQIEQITKSICAVLNNGFGNILIGVTSDKYKNIKGVKTDTKQFIDEVEDLLHKNLIPEKIFYTFTQTVYPFGQSSVIQLRISNISQKHFFYNSNHYSILNNKIEENNIELISRLSKKQIKNQLDQFHRTADLRLSKIHKDLELLTVSKNNFDLFNRLIENGIKFSQVLNIDLVYPTENKSLSKYFPHGMNNGNVYYGERSMPRFSDIYLRSTCPITNEVEFSGDKVYSSNALIIVPDGGSFIIDSDGEWNLINIEKNNPLLICKIKPEFSDSINIFTIIGWLKSSLSLWYMYNRFNSLNIHNPQIFKNIFIPTELFYNNTDSLIRERISKIIELEKEFLDESVAYYNLEGKTEDTKKVYYKKVDVHNIKIDSIALEIDQLINSCFSLSETEIEIIDRFLTIKDLHKLNQQ